MDAPALLNTATNNLNSSTITSGTISPTGGALLLIDLGTQANAGVASIGNWDISDTLTGTSAWTVIGTAHINNGTEEVWQMAAYAIAGPTPGSGTTTVVSRVGPGGAAQNTFRRILRIYEIASGYDGTTPIPQFKTGTGTTSALSLTLDGAPSAGSIVIGAVCSRLATGITPGTGYTEIGEAGSTSNTVRTQAQYDASPGTTCDWSALNTSGNAAVAYEVAASGGGAPATSGAAAAEGAGDATAEAAKGSIGSAPARGAGEPAATGAKASTAAVMFHGGGRPVAQGQSVPQTSGAAAFRGGGAGVTTGARASSGTAAGHGAGAPAASGAKASAGAAAAVTAGEGSATTGAPATVGAAAFRAGGAAAGQGAKASRGPASIGGGGTFVLTGARGSSAAAALFGGGAIVVTGMQATRGAARFAAGGHASASAVPIVALARYEFAGRIVRRVAREGRIVTRVERVGRVVHEMERAGVL